jgi:hypothetical protein
MKHFYSLSVIVLSMPIDMALEMDRHARGGERKVSAQNFEIDISNPRLHRTPTNLPTPLGSNIIDVCYFTPYAALT